MQCTGNGRRGCGAGVGPRLCFIELRLGSHFFGEFECLFCILEFAVAPLLRGLCHDRLHHTPLLQDARFGLHETARCNSMIGLGSGSGRIRRTEHVGKNVSMQSCASRQWLLLRQRCDAEVQCR